MFTVVFGNYFGGDGVGGVVVVNTIFERKGGRVAQTVSRVAFA